MSIYGQIKKHLMERHSITAFKAKAIIATAQSQPDFPVLRGFWSTEISKTKAHDCFAVLTYCEKIADIWVQHFN